jgi:hypothetical protein
VCHEREVVNLTVRAQAPVAGSKSSARIGTSRDEDAAVFKQGRCRPAAQGTQVDQFVMTVLRSLPRRQSNRDNKRSE